MKLPKKENVDKYVSGHFTSCPFCGDGAIEGGPVEIDGNIARQDISCAVCEKQWRDEYRLVSISVSVVDDNNQLSRWYSDEATAVKGMYIHEYQEIIDEHNKK